MNTPIEYVYVEATEQDYKETEGVSHPDGWIHGVNNLLEPIWLKRVPITELVGDANGKPKVVCFCGSTRFAEWFMIKRWELEKQGIITFGINILPDGYFEGEGHHGAEQEGVKHILDELHKRKIDLSDEVYILNVGGYIGESTRNELEYAKSIGKPITYLEPPGE